MKTLFVALIALAASNVQASYFATHCSNANGSVKWETGHNSNSIQIKVYTDRERTKTLPLNEVKIKLTGEKILKDVQVNDCKISPMYSSTTITSAKAVITSSKLDDTTETFVICEKHINGMMPCPDIQE